MTLHISEAEVQQVSPCRWPLKPSKKFPANKPPAKSSITRRRFELPSGGFFHYMAAADYTPGSWP